MHFASNHYFLEIVIFFAKMTKTLKKCQIWPFQLVTGAYMVKMIDFHARNEFQGVLVQKI